MWDNLSLLEHVLVRNFYQSNFSQVIPDILFSWSISRLNCKSSIDFFFNLVNFHYLESEKWRKKNFILRLVPCKLVSFELNMMRRLILSRKINFKHDDGTSPLFSCWLHSEWFRHSILFFCSGTLEQWPLFNGVQFVFIDVKIFLRINCSEQWNLKCFIRVDLTMLIETSNISS